MIYLMNKTKRKKNKLNLKSYIFAFSSSMSVRFVCIKNYQIYLKLFPIVLYQHLVKIVSKHLLTVRRRICRNKQQIWGLLNKQRERQIKKQMTDSFNGLMLILELYRNKKRLEQANMEKPSQTSTLLNSKFIIYASTQLNIYSLNEIKQS